eukprot:scaffold98373_cov75-Phaeocystis_antarctica.AAC.5
MTASNASRLCSSGSHHSSSAGTTIHVAEAAASGLDSGMGSGSGVGEARPPPLRRLFSFASAFALMLASPSRSLDWARATSCSASGRRFLIPKPLRCSASGVVLRHAASSLLFCWRRPPRPRPPPGQPRPRPRQLPPLLRARWARSTPSCARTP